MRRKKAAAIANLFALMVEMWSDIQQGRVRADNFSVVEYAQKYHVGKFKRAMIAPYVTQDECPTYDQAEKLRRDLSKAIHEKSKQKKKINVEVEVLNLFDNEDKIRDAINLLKSHDYVVFKKV